LLENHPNASLLVGNSIYLKGAYKTKVIANRDPWLGLIVSNLGITSSNLWKRSSVEDVGDWNVKLTSSQEYDLLFRILKKNEYVLYDDAFLTIIHRTENSISTSKSRQHVNALNRIKLREEIKD